MNKTYEILQLKKYVPQILLKLLGYKVISQNEECTSYQKIVYRKDEYNYAVACEIHIFLDNVTNIREICVVPHYLRNNIYEWFKGRQALTYLYDLDKRLVKYTEIGVVK